MLRLLAVLTVAAVGPLSVECDGPRVSISGLGAVVGETVHFQHHSYPSIDTYIDVYRGIPYVEKPERFGKPQPKKPWSGDFDASQFGADCPQPGSKAASEDCLFMNIWVPNPRPRCSSSCIVIAV
ncbi:acetylcholinesterase-like [Acanthaster planci]|uniref:Acetylcholinesterase-like n=1 Tax=Acanthaster planci TaxID=133434 RepID=A0A8B7Z5S5_ACAPL|nr:acetylcholinesterase-like [Acanthaster planci]